MPIKAILSSHSFLQFRPSPDSPSPPRYIINYAGLQPIPHYDPDKDGKYAQWFKQFITIGEKISAKQMRDYYLANLDCLDENIVVLMDALDELKLTDNTMVVFFSDNGGPRPMGRPTYPWLAVSSPYGKEVSGFPLFYPAPATRMGVKSRIK